MLLQLSKTVKQSPKSPQIFENNGTFCADRPFSKNRSETNCQKSFVFNQLVSELQSYILSTTTETCKSFWDLSVCDSFNRTSFQQQLKLICRFSLNNNSIASIVHPFNNNWNKNFTSESILKVLLQSYILSTTTETRLSHRYQHSGCKLQSYILSTTTETDIVCGRIVHSVQLQSYILSTTTETTLMPNNFPAELHASIVHPFNNNWNTKLFL